MFPELTEKSDYTRAIILKRKRPIFSKLLRFYQEKCKSFLQMHTFFLNKSTTTKQQPVTNETLRLFRQRVMFQEPNKSSFYSLYHKSLAP